MQLSLLNTLDQNYQALTLRDKKVVERQWHAPWKLKRVIAGHTGWVRSIAVDPMNKFFATGSCDRTIKFWDLI
jgi:pleiotropic regulator 1